MFIKDFLQEYTSPPQTQTAAFKRWFGNSKVVDAEGNPMRMYHGTSHPHIKAFEVGFNSFGNKNFSGNHKVLSFTTDPDFANGYAGINPWVRLADGATIYPVYIRSENPGDFRNPEHVEKLRAYYTAQKDRWFEEVKISHPHIWTPDKVAETRAQELKQLEKHINHGSWTVWESPGMWKIMGWDGAWTREEPHHENAHILNFAVADGRQVKSAVGNSMFDPESPSLTEGKTLTKVKDDLTEIRAYHGSNHNFEEFSDAHIGTGKGYQTFGWGIYLTKEKKIASRYRKRGTGNVYVVDMPDVSAFEAWARQKGAVRITGEATSYSLPFWWKMGFRDRSRGESLVPIWKILD